MMNKKYGLFLSIVVSVHFLSGMVVDTSVDPDKGFEKSIDVVPEKPKSSSIVAPGEKLSSPADDKTSVDQKSVNQDAVFKNDNLDAEASPSEPAKTVSSQDGAAPQDAPKETPKEGEKKEGSEIDYQGKGDTLKNEAAKADTENKQTAFYGDSSKEYTETQMVAGSDQNSKEAEDASDMTMMLAAGAAAAAVGVGALGIALAKGDLDKLGDKAKDLAEGKGGRTDYKSGLVKQKLQKDKILKEEAKLKQLRAERTALAEKSRNATGEEKKKLEKQLMDKRKKVTESLDTMKKLKEKKASIDADVKKNKAKLSKNLDKAYDGDKEKKKKSISDYKEDAHKKAEAKQLAKEKSLKTAVKSKLPSLPKVQRPAFMR